MSNTTDAVRHKRWQQALIGMLALCAHSHELNYRKSCLDSHDWPRKMRIHPLRSFLMITVKQTAVFSVVLMRAISSRWPQLHTQKTPLDKLRNMCLNTKSVQNSHLSRDVKTTDVEWEPNRCWIIISLQYVALVPSEGNIHSFSPTQQDQWSKWILAKH